MPVKNKRDGSIGVVLHQWNSGSIAVLENINPRVINTHDSWSTLEIITDEVKQIHTKDDSIPKQKAKELEEKYNQLMNEYHKRVQEIIDLDQDLKILQDDLEDKRIVYIDTPEFKNSYIPKQKIKDKIKELEENKSDDNISGSDLTVEEFNNEVINILKEIIE